MASSLKGINEIEAEIVSLVRNTVSTTLKASGSVATDALNVSKDVVKGTIQATEEVGTGLILSTKSVAKGVIMGVADAFQLLQGFYILLFNPVAWEREELIEATKEVGGNVEGMATAAVGAAIEAARTIGNTAVKAVTEMLVGVVAGVKEVAGAALPKTEAKPSPESPSHGARAETTEETPKSKKKGE